jgi:hypothetical protein
MVVHTYNLSNQKQDPVKEGRKEGGREGGRERGRTKKKLCEGDGKC